MQESNKCYTQNCINYYFSNLVDFPRCYPLHEDKPIKIFVFHYLLNKNFSRFCSVWKLALYYGWIHPYNIKKKHLNYSNYSQTTSDTESTVLK